MSELKPCPFCGSSDVGLEPEWSCRYQCNDCGALSPQCATRDSEGAKASKWNRRVSTQFLVRDNREPDEFTDYNVGLFIGDTIVTRSGTGIDCYTEWMEVPQ